MNSIISTDRNFSGLSMVTTKPLIPNFSKPDGCGGSLTDLPARSRSVDHFQSGAGPAGEYQDDPELAALMSEYGLGSPPEDPGGQQWEDGIGGHGPSGGSLVSRRGRRYKQWTKEQMERAIRLVVDHSYKSSRAAAVCAVPESSLREHLRRRIARGETSFSFRGKSRPSAVQSIGGKRSKSNKSNCSYERLKLRKLSVSSGGSTSPDVISSSLTVTSMDESTSLDKLINCAHHPCPSSTVANPIDLIVSSVISATPSSSSPRHNSGHCSSAGDDHDPAGFPGQKVGGIIATEGRTEVSSVGIRPPVKASSFDVGRESHHVTLKDDCDWSISVDESSPPNPNGCPIPNADYVNSSIADAVNRVAANFQTYQCDDTAADELAAKDCVLLASDPSGIALSAVGGTVSSSGVGVSGENQAVNSGVNGILKSWSSDLYENGPISSPFSSILSSVANNSKSNNEAWNRIVMACLANAAQTNKASSSDNSAQSVATASESSLNPSTNDAGIAEHAVVSSSRSTNEDELDQPEVLEGDAEVLMVQTGGTIDKDYPRSTLGYAFEIGPPAAGRILERARATMAVRWETVCQKDSQEITNADVAHLCTICSESTLDKIIVTHGTDTMLDTAQILAALSLPKVIIITGAFRPERFRDSDADFNLGMALGAVQCLSEPGVYVVMNGQLGKWDQIKRDEGTGAFMSGGREGGE